MTLQAAGSRTGGLRGGQHGRRLEPTTRRARLLSIGLSAEMDETVIEEQAKASDDRRKHQSATHSPAVEACAEFLKRERELAGISQCEAGRKAGMAKSQVWTIENRHTGNGITITTLAKLMRAYPQMDLELLIAEVAKCLPE